MLLRSRSSRQRSGVTVVVVALILPVLMLIIGFSVDLAYMQLARTELRAATDLAAKAASTELSDTGSTALAIAKGKQVAANNQVAGESLTLENADFIFGNTDRSTTGRWSFTPNAVPTNAVRVSARRTATAPDGEVDLFFAGLMGGGGFQTTFSATSGFVNADICLVLDRSSSMKLAVADTATGLDGEDPRTCDVPWSDSRWVAVDNAIGLFISHMGTTLSDEKVGVVTFASNYTACSVTTSAATLDQPLTSNLGNVTSTLATLTSSVWNGATEISVGMALARTELNGPNSRNTAQKIMVVLTDGAFTNGIHPDGQAALAAGDGIRVHTITFGAVPAGVITNMEDTAAAGNGQHYHAPDSETLNEVFTEIAGSISVLTR